MNNTEHDRANAADGANTSPQIVLYMIYGTFKGVEKAKKQPEKSRSKKQNNFKIKNNRSREMK